MAINKKEIIEYMNKGFKMFGAKYLGYILISPEDFSSIKCNRTSVESLLKSKVIKTYIEKELILNKSHVQH